jgi:hypothetical protein
LTEQLWVGPQGVQAPPQSTSVSLPLRTVSLHAGAEQIASLHTPEPQSPPKPHPAPSGQPGHEPPQSVSVSLPLMIPSVQLGAWHELAVHTCEAQSDAALQ